MPNLLLALVLITAESSVQAAEHQQPPCSYRLLYDEQKKCAFGSRDAVELLKRECLRDGGHP